MVAGSGLARFWWFEFGMALVLLGAKAHPVPTVVGAATDERRDGHARYSPRRRSAGHDGSAGEDVREDGRLSDQEQDAFARWLPDELSPSGAGPHAFDGSQGQIAGTAREAGLPDV